MRLAASLARLTALGGKKAAATPQRHPSALVSAERVIEDSLAACGW